MADSMDSLSIEITQDTSDAVNGVELLQKSLENLKRATKGGVGLNAVINQLKAFDDVSKDMGKNLSKVDFDSFTKNVKKLSTALQPLQGFKTQATGLINSLRGFKDTAEEFNEFTDFGAFSSQVRRLATSLEPLNNISGKLGATLRALEQLPMIGQQLQTTNFTEFATNIQTLTNSLVPLSTVQSKLGSTLNQLSRFSQISQQLGITMVDTNVATNIKNLVEALRPLSEMGKSQLGSFLNQLKKLPEIMQSLTEIDMDAFAVQIQRVTDAIRPLANEMNKVAAGFSAFPIRIRKIIEQNEKLATSNVKTSKSFGILGTGISRVKAKMMVYIYAAKRLAGVMAGWVVESNAYVENLNLFRVSMREASEEALDYANKVYDAFGVDPSEWIRYQAVFQNMATGFGIVSDKATIMSKNLTQLGYDLATIFNVDYSVAMQKLQSAIAGQPRPMREWGFDMSETTLKMVALNHGIKENVELMTQNEKAQLRFIQLMETANKQGILGNFAREIHTPANAFRILNQQIVMFKRALGDMMIPILIKVLPYIQALVKVLTDAVRALAALFGFELPLIDYSGLGDLPAITDDIEDGFDDATGAAKKLQNALAPFDELNILPQLSSSSSGTGAAGGVGGDLGFDFSEYDYDFLGDNIQNKVNEIAEQLKEPFESILKTVGMIGLGIGAWKVSNALYTLFTGEGTSAFAQAVRAFGKQFVPSGETIKLASLLGNSTAYVTTATVIAGIATTMAIIVARSVDLIKNSELFRLGLQTIWDGLKKGVDWITKTAIPAIGEFFSNLIPPELKSMFSDVFGTMNEWMKKLDLDAWDVLLTLGSIALLFTPAAPFAAAVLTFEALSVGVRLVGYAASDSIEEIDILGEGISDITKIKMEPFLNQMRSLDDSITEIDWTNIIIDQDIVDDISGKVKAISETILDELSADRNEALATLEPLREALGEEAYNKLVADNTAYYNKLTTQVEQNEAEIIAIYQRASDENRALTEDERKEVNRIRSEMNDTGVKHLSETEVEYTKIMNRLKDNSVRVSLEQASEIIKNAQKTRNEAIDAAETQYAKVELEAQRMLDVGAINEEQYDEIIRAAQEARDGAIKAAEEQYTDIYSTTQEKLGDTAKYIDLETGEIKSKWETWTENLSTKWGEKWVEMKDELSRKLTEIKENIKTWFENDVSPWFTKEKWLDIMKGVKEAITTTFTNAINAAIELFNRFIGWLNDKMKFEWDGVVIGGKTILDGGSIQLFTIPEIPKLAAGAVIPPNKEFIATLGDQKSGVNIETPEKLLRQIVREEIDNLPQPEINIIASGDEGGLIRYMKFEIDKETKRLGRNLVEGSTL